MALLCAATALEAQQPRGFAVAQSAFVFSAGLDLGSTLYVLDRCPSCRETNPLLPVGRSKVGLVIGATVLTAGQVWLADRLAHSERTRHWWWLVPVSGTVTHLLAAKANTALLQ